MKKPPKFKKWHANLGPTRCANANFLAYSPEALLADVEEKAARWHEMLLKQALPPGTIASIRRAADDGLRWCTYTLAEPAPPALVELIRALMNVQPPRAGIKNREKYNAANWFVVDNPEATATALKRKFNLDYHTAKRWLGSPEFQTLAARRRHSKKLYG